MAKRPSHKQESDKRQRGKIGRIVDWPEDVPSAAEVAARVIYRGNAKHKNYRFQGETGKLRSRDDQSCDHFADEQVPIMVATLQRAIIAGFVAKFRGGFPSRVWAWVNDRLHEARLDEGVPGQYHAFPIDDERCYPVPFAKLKEAPRVDIPVV